MHYQLEFITKTQKPTLIIFVHGLVGGRHTWIRKDGKHSVLNYLHASPGLREQNDFAVFSYYTKFNDLLARASHFVKPFFYKNTPYYQQNLSVDEIAGIFKSEIEVQGYRQVVLISHSMGGLVAKSLILRLAQEKQRIAEKEKKLLLEKEQLLEKRKRHNALQLELQGGSIRLIEEDIKALQADETKLAAELAQAAADKNKLPGVTLYISLAVPHEGANLAIWGMMLLKSRQVANLAPLNKDRRAITHNWLKTPPALLPDTVYFKGNNDRIVARASAEAYDIRDNIKVVETSDNHFSIVCPNNSHNIVVTRIKEELRRVQGIADTGVDDENMALPPLATKNVKAGLKPRYWAFALAAVLLGALLLFLLILRPLSKNRDLKAKITERLDMKLYYRPKKAGYQCGLADYMQDEDKVPDSLKGYSLADFLDKYYNSERNPPGGGVFLVENKKKDTFYTLKFIQQYNSDVFIVRYNGQYCHHVFSIDSNQSRWEEFYNSENFCKIIFKKEVTDTLVLLIPKEPIDK